MCILPSFRKFRIKVLAEVLIKKRWKIKCGIGAEEDDSSAYYGQLEK